MCSKSSTELLSRITTPVRYFAHSTRPFVSPLRFPLFARFTYKSTGVLGAQSSGNGSIPVSSTFAFSSEAVSTLSDEVLEDDQQQSTELSSDSSGLGLPEGFVEETVIEVESDKTDESLLLKNCGLSKSILNALEKRDITALFPIQKHVFDPAMEGRDLIGRAKTGSGKTLAFAIPVVEKLIKENQEIGQVKRGRAPRALVITPTRELANQVSREFQSICPTLSVRPFYGGVSVGGNRKELENGVDVAIGTPGRLMDLVDQRALDLSKVRFAILDESDQMLDMGFEQDMEKLLAYTPRDKQTMLFSATLPNWVRKVARKYLKDHLIVDLLGEEGSGRVSDTVKVLGMLVQGSTKRQLLGDLLSVYAAGKKSIVFTQTKREADAIYGVCDSAVSSAVLHGDIAQATREATLERFRRGRVHCMVATDVAARGLDIPSVDLVVHYDCPETHESFVHRSGRTGRAGLKGTTIVMVTNTEVHGFHRTLRETKTKIEMIAPPSPRDVMQSSTKHVLEKMAKVQPEILKFFEPAAKKLMENGDSSQILAASIALLAGFDKLPTQRSLLTQEAGKVTLRLLARPGRINGFGQVVAILTDLIGKKFNSHEMGKVEMIRDEETHMTGALVDVPTKTALQLLQNASSSNNEIKGVRVDRPKSLSFEQVLAQCGPDRQSSGRRRNQGRNSSSRNSFGSRNDRSFGGGGGGRYGSSYQSDDRSYDRNFDRRGGGGRSGGGYRDFDRRGRGRFEDRSRRSYSNRSYNDDMVW
eukprot:g7434.t1